MVQSPPWLRCRHAGTRFPPYVRRVLSPVMGYLPQHCISLSSILHVSQNDTGGLLVGSSVGAEVFIPHFRDIVNFLHQLAGISAVLFYPVGDQLFSLVYIAL